MLTYKEYKKYKQKRKDLHSILWLLKASYRRSKYRFERLPNPENYRSYHRNDYEYRNAVDLYNSINSLLRLHKILYKQTLK